MTPAPLSSGSSTRIYVYRTVTVYNTMMQFRCQRPRRAFSNSVRTAARQQMPTGWGRKPIWCMRRDSPAIRVAKFSQSPVTSRTHQARWWNPRTTSEFKSLTTRSCPSVISRVRSSCQTPNHSSATTSVATSSTPVKRTGTHIIQSWGKAACWLQNTGIPGTSTHLSILSRTSSTQLSTK